MYKRQVVDEVPSAGVKPRLVKAYDGGDIVLNAEKNIVMSPDEFESLKAVVGHDLIAVSYTHLDLYKRQTPRVVSQRRLHNG